MISWIIVPARESVPVAPADQKAPHTNTRYGWFGNTKAKTPLVQPTS